MKETDNFVHLNPNDERSLLIPTPVAYEMENENVPPAGISPDQYEMMAQREVIGTNGLGSLRAESYQDRAADKSAEATEQLIDEVLDPAELLKLKDTLDPTIELINSSGRWGNDLKTFVDRIRKEAVKGYVNRAKTANVEVPELVLNDISRIINLPKDRLQDKAKKATGKVSEQDNEEQLTVLENDSAPEPRTDSTPEPSVARTESDRTAAEVDAQTNKRLELARARYAQMTAARRTKSAGRFYSKRNVARAAEEYRQALRDANATETLDGQAEFQKLSLDTAMTEAQLLARQLLETPKGRLEPTVPRTAIGRWGKRALWNRDKHLKFHTNLIHMPPRPDPWVTQEKPPVLPDDREYILHQISQNVMDSDSPNIQPEHITDALDATTTERVRTNRYRALGQLLMAAAPIAHDLYRMYAQEADRSGSA